MKLITLLLLLPLLSLAQQEWRPVAGLSLGTGKFMLNAGIEAGATKGRFMGLAQATHYIGQGITSYNIKGGAIAIYRDSYENDVIYLLAGWGMYRYTDAVDQTTGLGGTRQYRAQSASLAIRWQYYNGVTEVGYQDQGIYFKVGWQFRKINR
jgi:hypothetical protein